MSDSDVIFILLSVLSLHKYSLHYWVCNCNIFIALLKVPHYHFEEPEPVLGFRSFAVRTTLGFDPPLLSRESLPMLLLVFNFVPEDLTIELSCHLPEDHVTLKSLTVFQSMCLPLCTPPLIQFPHGVKKYVINLFYHRNFFFMKETFPCLLL